MMSMVSRFFSMDTTVPMTEPFGVVIPSPKAVAQWAALSMSRAVIEAPGTMRVFLTAKPVLQMPVDDQKVAPPHHGAQSSWREHVVGNGRSPRFSVTGTPTLQLATSTSPSIVAVMPLPSTLPATIATPRLVATTRLTSLSSDAEYRAALTSTGSSVRMRSIKAIMSRESSPFQYTVRRLASGAATIPASPLPASAASLIWSAARSIRS
jgi:hypothetical protein